MQIRAAIESDVPRMQAIERSAGAAFADIGMQSIADDEPLSVPGLLAYVEGGRAWVCVTADDIAIAYLIADVIDGNGHIEQVSVDPAHARQGLGRALIERAAQWARGWGARALTLMTFADVPWNAPYYSRLGFVVLPVDAMTPGLHVLRRHETELGIDRWPRVGMRRDL